MALFKSKEEKAEEKRRKQEELNAIYQKLAEAEILDSILNNLQNGEEWRHTCQSYYDKRTRRICIDKDLFRIMWMNGDKRTKRIGPDGKAEYQIEEVVVETDSYSYTSSGYEPLPKGYVRMWTEVVRERMMAMWPQCRFGEICFGDSLLHDYAYYFEYTVPAIQWKRWF